jgi:hypothetical protein
MHACVGVHGFVPKQRIGFLLLLQVDAHVQPALRYTQAVAVLIPGLALKKPAMRQPACTPLQLEQSRDSFLAWDVKWAVGGRRSVKNQNK